MELAVDSRIPTYSGGLGVLAGDTVRSCADLRVPLVAVTLFYRKGYFYQELDADGNQKELPSEWNPEDFMKRTPHRVTVSIEGRPVVVGAWEYNVRGADGYRIPVVFLDTDVEENGEYDRSLAWWLYGGDERYRLCQEAVLGVGGVRMLAEMGYRAIDRYHMNEGHSALLALELLNERRKLSPSGWDVDGVRAKCVFTTHTPVAAGHDKFSYELVKRVLPDSVPLDVLRELGGQDALNMTLLALNLSHYENGVAKAHGKTSQAMFPGYHIDSITNGVYSPSWVCDSFGALYDRYIEGWRKDPFSLRYALSIPGEEVWEAHRQAKEKLIDYVNAETNAGLDYHDFTVAAARRATAYKRADLIFSDLKRLRSISRQAGKVQLVLAGKAHPVDSPGKDLIRRVFSVAKSLKGDVRVVYLQNYDVALARMLVSGADLWLNTPRKPHEASGTSGMKAAHNGVPSLSVLDGWWIEGCIEGLTGWSIGSPREAESNDQEDAASLYDKLEKTIVPLFYGHRTKWVEIMRNCIAINGSFFNTHRMVQQYVLNAYFH
ncbi:MAG: alpha-glucan family phosphorylase [Candidatus Eisenbacteria bacterium]|nr:alpha-glucan family phosphorylase [Candidatus Eisenbacteria bacterium]